MRRISFHSKKIQLLLKIVGNIIITYKIKVITIITYYRITRNSKKISHIFLYSKKNIYIKLDFN